MEDLFKHLKNIYGNSHQKEHAIQEFRELKIGASLYTNFYSKFIQLLSDLEYTLEILIRELKHKLTPQL